MLHAGLDLSHNRLDVCLPSEHGELVDEFAVPSDRWCSRARDLGRAKAGGAADAHRRHLRARATKARPHHDPCGRRPGRRQPRRAALPAGQSERAVGRGHHLPAQLGRLALPRPPSRTPSRARSLAGRSYAREARRRRARDGTRPAAPRSRARPSLGTRAANTSRSGSARPLATPASRSRWAPNATSTTTPLPRASSRRSRRNSSTATRGQPPRARLRRLRLHALPA
jgi:hypothetical protein